MFLLDPARKALVEAKVLQERRFELCRTCPDVKVNLVAGVTVHQCTFCNCVMSVKTAVPSATCANPTNPRW